MNTNIPRPMVHLNGTSGRTLFEQAMKACEAVKEARDAVSEAFPNGRDYYPQGASAYDKARNYYEKMLASLDEMATFFLDQAIAIDTESGARGR